VNTNRVPALTRGQQPHAVFFPERVASFNASNLGIQDLPPVTFPRGHYEFDWVSIARHFVKELIAGKAEIKPSNSFFDPLPVFQYDSNQNASESAFEFTAMREEPAEIVSTLGGSPLKGQSNSSAPLKPTSSAKSNNQMDTSTRASAAPLQDILTSLTVLPSTSVFIKLKAVAALLERDITQIAPVAELMDSSRITVRNYATRLSEQSLETACEELFSLSRSAVNLLEESDTAWIRSPLRQLMDRTNAPSSGWSPLLKSAIEALFIGNLPAIVLCVLEVWNEKSFTKDASLNADITESLRKVFSDISEELELEFKTLSGNINEKRTLLLECQRELQMVGSTLEEHTDHLLNSCNEDDVLRKMKFLQGYVNRTDSRGAKLLNKMLSKNLKVKHFGPLMRFIRQLLGRFMLELVHLSSQYSHGTEFPPTAKLDDNEKSISDEIAFDAVSAEARDPQKEGPTKRSRSTWLDKFKRNKDTKPVKVYRELVPPEWEEQQNRDTESLLNRKEDVAAEFFPDDENSWTETALHNDNDTWERDYWKEGLSEETSPRFTAFDKMREQRFSRFLDPNAAERLDGLSVLPDETNDDNLNISQADKDVEDIPTSGDEQLSNSEPPNDFLPMKSSETIEAGFADSMTATTGDQYNSSIAPVESSDSSTSGIPPPLSTPDTALTVADNSPLRSIAQLLPPGDDWRNETEIRELLQCEDSSWEKLLALGLLKLGKATKKFGMRYQILREKMLETLVSDEAIRNILPTISSEVLGLLERFYSELVVEGTGVALSLFGRAWLGGQYWALVLSVIQEASRMLRCSSEDFLRLASRGAVNLDFVRAVFRTLRDGSVEGTAGVDWNGALLAEELRSFEQLQEELSFNRHELEELLEEERIPFFLIDGKCFILAADSRNLVDDELEDI